MPQALLIYCEGKTEEAYFNILLDIFRLPRYVKVEVSGQRGQHLALIDNAVKERSRFCEAEGLDTEEAECWAVCDDDGMTCSYTELERYSEERDVHLAFARPQFESFLLQHFEQSGETDICEIFHRLTVHRNENGGAGAYAHDHVVFNVLNGFFGGEFFGFRHRGCTRFKGRGSGLFQAQQ